MINCYKQLLYRTSKDVYKKTLNLSYILTQLTDVQY